jgi:hypothetical protein
MLNFLLGPALSLAIACWIAIEMYASTHGKRETMTDGQDRMFLIGEPDALDELVGQGQLLWNRVQTAEQRVGGMYPRLTIIPTGEDKPYEVALLPTVFDYLNSVSGGIVTLEEEEEANGRL